MPISIVSNYSARITEQSFSMHFIFKPISRVISSILIEKFPRAVSHSVFFLPFISRAVGILLNNKFYIIAKGLLSPIIFSLGFFWLIILRLLISDIIECGGFYILRVFLE